MEYLYQDYDFIKEERDQHISLEDDEDQYHSETYLLTQFQETYPGMENVGCLLKEANLVEKATKKTKSNAFCYVCEHVFTQKQSLLNHFTRIHPAFEIKVQFKCSECDELFQKNADLSKHSRTHKKAVKDLGTKCNICSKRFQKSFYLRKHVRVMHESGASKSKKKNVMKPTATSSNNNSSEFENAWCCICQVLFFSRIALRNHFSIAHPGQEVIWEYKCPECDKCCKTNNHLRKHRECAHPSQEMQTGKLECKLCNKNVSNLFKHRFKSHFEIFTCFLCAITFLTTSALEDHLKKMHPNSNEDFENFKCLICENRLSSKSTLEMHIAHYHKIKCGKCLIRFSEKSSLIEHIMQKHSPGQLSRTR